MNPKKINKLFHSGELSSENKLMIGARAVCGRNAPAYIKGYENWIENGKNKEKHLCIYWEKKKYGFHIPLRFENLFFDMIDHFLIHGHFRNFNFSKKK